VNFGAVGPPWWGDRPCLIVGTGPSLHGFDLARLRGLGHVLAVKEAYHELPFADAVFGLDLPWMEHERVQLTALAARLALYLAVPDDRAVDIPGATYLRQLAGYHLSRKADTINAGGHSGFGALNFAYLKRAKTVYLFGFDYSGAHYYADGRYTRDQVKSYSVWAAAISAVKPQLTHAGLNVVNVSPASLVQAYPKVSVEQALLDLRSYPGKQN